MDFKEIQPIPEEAVLMVDRKIMVIADLHIGIEKELKDFGLNVSSQTQKMTDRAVKLCKEYKPEKIILLGDIKHNIPSSTVQERKDVKSFLRDIKRYGETHLVSGNHDGNIEKLVSKDVLVHSFGGLKIKDIGFIHGHRWPRKEVMKCNQIIMAHTHPTIQFSDRLGYKTYEPCWIKARFVKKKLKEKYPNSDDPKLLVIPPFNPLCGGIAVNKDGVVGPIGKIMDIQNSKVYLLDGSFLGKVRNI